MSEWRADPATGRWIVVADELPLARRDFVVDGVARPLDTPCPFCEGHELVAGREIAAVRDSGVPDEPGWRLRVVPNRVPALRVEAGSETVADGLHVHRPGLGAHEVVIEDPRHDWSWYAMNAAEIGRVLEAWRGRIADLARDTRLRSAVAFKSHGAEAGARLVHTHSQVVATPMVPPGLEAEVQGAARHHAATGRCLGCDLVATERATGLRVVVDGPGAVALTPFASGWPFTVWVVPVRHLARFDQAAEDDIATAAATIVEVLARLARALERPAFHAVLHTAPYGVAADGPFHWFVEVVPRVLRPSGLALGVGLPINPVAPERAARVLRGEA
ncbi:MAG: hypothetical protein R2745_05055 [Vicinamibacterales bacterium]